MRNEKIITKKGVPAEIQIQAAEELLRKRKRGLELLPGELPKSPEVLKFIEKINKYIAEELHDLDLEFDSKVVPEQIHLLPDAKYIKHAPKNSRGTYYQNEDMYVVRGGLPRLQMFKTILHEALHKVSFHAWSIAPKTGEEGRRIVEQHRTGYGGKEHLDKFDEGVIDVLVIRILARHADELREIFHITPEEETEGVNSYKFEVDLVSAIIKKIAEKNQERFARVLYRFARGLFTGEMMHLRDIERTFGGGSLRILAAMDEGIKKLPKEEKYRLVQHYFETDDQEEKDAIAAKILSEDELKHYAQRQG